MSLQETPTVEKVWEEFADSLRGFVRRRIADPHRAEDVVSDVFLRIHRKIHTITDDERLASWVFTIARNAVTDEYRRAARRREELMADPASELTDPGLGEGDEGEGGIDELAACMRPLLARLPEHHRRAVELADLQGVTQADAARIEGISVSGMKSRVQRGRRELRAVLSACCAVSVDARGRPFEYTPVSRKPCGCGSGEDRDGGC